MQPEEKGGAFMVAKGPHIILESTTGGRVRWIALPLLPVGLLAQRRVPPGEADAGCWRVRRVGEEGESEER